MIRLRSFQYVAGLAVVIATSGCDQTVDKPDRPTQAERPPNSGDGIAANVPEPPPVDPVKLQDDAMEAFESGDLNTAFQLVRSARSVAPDDPQINFLMASVLAEKNRFAEAIKLLDELAESVPAARLPALGQTAEWMVIQGNWREAERRYRVLLDEVSDTSLVDRRLSQLLIRQGRRLEAAAFLRELCRAGDIEESELRSLLMTVHPFSGEAANDELEPIGDLGHARYEISQGNWDAALEELDRPASERPDEAALRGRIYAHLQDFESLDKWVSVTPESAKLTADYWFAMGVHQAHGGDHQAAVKCFCEAVLRDQTDHQAYLLMSQSLEELEADAEAQEASKRAKLIQQTQVIGNQLAASANRKVQTMSTLSDLLGELRRPYEALAWRAVQVVYGQSDQAAMQALREINRNRLQRLEANDTDATEHFLICGVDLDSLRRIDDADTPSKGQK